ncbi:hypothetical protein EQ826_23880 [Ectopseudomonas mendocina]|nr:hypothetical protein [Pseudomonas mendocina]TRO11773.1 hypothetical protein EQ828_23485 [Pseudomonas mendocina]TRO19819.1 hypothetical protein EQ826_23880 [Pseudomonas mendocina]
MPTPVLKPFLIDGHHFEAEDLAQGFLINPVLPECFDTTPNAERSYTEMAMWWERPFIVRKTWAQFEQHTINWQARRRALGEEGALSEEETEALVEKDRAGFFEEYPAGEQYTVRCLDGGAWDRSTWWGNSPTLEGALDLAVNGPLRRRK